VTLGRALLILGVPLCALIALKAQTPRDAAERVAAFVCVLVVVWLSSKLDRR
jgi:hypothetical protein